VQSFMLTKVTDCGLPIVITSSTFLKRKDMLKRKKQLAQIIKTHIYIYTYIYIHKYIYINAHSCVRLIVVSVYILCCQADFQVLRDFSTPDCFVVYLCLIRVDVVARACAYIYIGRIYMCMCIYYKYIHTKSLCVWTDVARGVHMCLDIFFIIYTQGLHVYIYIHAHRVHTCRYVFTYMHPRFICVCVYITYIHAEFTCACEYDGEVDGHRVQTNTGMWVCMYLHVDTRSLGVGMCVRIYLRTLYGCVYTFVCLRLYVHVYTHGVYMCVCTYSRIYIQRLYK